MTLLDKQPFSTSGVNKTVELLDELKEEFKYHYDHNSLFRKICQQSGWIPSDEITDLAALPFLPAQYFKEFGEKLASVPEGDLLKVLSSSATSGHPSSVPIDKDTSRRQVKALVSVLRDFIGNQRRPFLIVDAMPDTNGSRSVSARTAAMSGFSTFASSRTNILKKSAGELLPDYEALDAFLAEISYKQQPVCVAGFTFLLYSALLEKIRLGGKKYRLPEGSVVIHIGGWKKLEEKKVDAVTLKKEIEELLGISPDKVFDIYGFTEQMGTCYVECPEGNKHVPAFAEVIVRDPQSLSQLDDGGIGVGQFLSTVPHSYAGFSVLTDDLVQVTGRDNCNCGRKGTTFKVLGRNKSVEIRGCGDVLAEKVLVKDSSPKECDRADGNIAGLKDDVQAVCLFSNGKVAKRITPDFSGMPRISSWEETEARLRDAQARLVNYGVDDIIGVLDAACDVWGDRSSPFSVYHTRGLSYIVNIVKTGKLQNFVDLSMRGVRGALDNFQPEKLGGDRRIRAIPRGIVAHWLAGNVPTLGLLSLMMSLVTKNANIVKAPSRSGMLLPSLIETLSSVNYITPGGSSINGKVVADAVEVVYFPAKSIDGREMSSISDVRVAWGGAEAVRSIVSLPRKYDAVDLVFGPKISAAAIGRESLSSISKAKRVARGVATDVSVFDQEACASAHNIYVEQGGEVSPLEFSQLLAEQMKKALKRIPSSEISAHTMDRIKSARGKHFLDGEVFSSDRMDWTVLYRETEVAGEPVYGRTAIIRSVNSLNDMLENISRETQVIGLSLPTERRVELAEEFAKRGVDRITSVGHMADFNLPWDGMYAMEGMTRWVSLV